MPAYVVVNLDVNDPEMFTRYRDEVTPLVYEKGGKYLAVDFDSTALDGSCRQGLAILEFDTVRAAQEFYNSPEYRAIIGLRLGSTDGWARLIPGLEMT